MHRTCLLALSLICLLTFLAHGAPAQTCLGATEVVSLDFEDHPFEVQKFDKPCALCGAEQVYLDEVILDDRGGRMFVCSDTDFCEKRRADGHRGHLSGEGAEAAE